MTLSLELLLIGILVLSCLFTTSIFNQQQDQALAQPYIQTIKYRNLVIDLGNGVKTNAQLTLPVLGNGPFPGVLLIPGSGVADKNETLGFVHKNGPKPPTTPLLQIAQYLSERGFGVLRYDKRGVGANYTILDPNVWGNATANDLILDSKKALNVLMQRPEVDPKRISILGHSEGTLYAPRVAIDDPTKVKNIILMGTMAQNPVKDLYYYQVVISSSEYAKQVLDKNHTGLVSIQQLATDPVVRKFLVPLSVLLTNNTEGITKALQRDFGTDNYISIDKQLNPSLIKVYENITAFNSSKCNTSLSAFGRACPLWWKSVSSLIPNLSIIGNVSKSTGVLLLNGENDSQTPVQQAFLLQQRLTEVNHPDHTLITYPDLGHIFYPSSKWSTGIGPIEQYVLADLYSWLESHSGISHSFATTTSAATSHMANMTSLSTNTTSPNASSRSK